MSFHASPPFPSDNTPLLPLLTFDGQPLKVERRYQSSSLCIIPDGLCHIT